MKVSRLLVAGFCAYALSGFWGVALADQSTVVAADSSQVVTVTASNWKFTPAEITVHAGKPVTLQLSSSEGVHGFASSDFGIASTIIAPGSTKTVKFTPSKVGTYTIHCSVMCGQGHSNMTLVIRVVA